MIEILSLFIAFISLTCSHEKVLLVAISLSLILLIDQATTLLSIELEQSSALIESKLNILKINPEYPKKVKQIFEIFFMMEF